MALEIRGDIVRYSSSGIESSVNAALAACSIGLSISYTYAGVYSESAGQGSGSSPCLGGVLVSGSWDGSAGCHAEHVCSGDEGVIVIVFCDGEAMYESTYAYDDEV